MGRLIFGQILGSTVEDSQGERYGVDFLQELVDSMPARIPIYQQHDMGRTCAGYIKNARIAQHPTLANEWAILGDVELTDQAASNPDLKGFSWSAIVEVTRRGESPAFGHYLPYPAYNRGALDDLLDQPEPVRVGKWLKKAADPGEVSLLVAAIVFFITPVWDQVFKKVLWPRLEKQFEILRERWWTDRRSTDLVQLAQMPSGEPVQIIFVPERGSEALAYSKQMLETGFQRASTTALAEWNEGRTPTRVRLVFDRARGWMVIGIEDVDGNSRHFVP